ncbi:MAG: hypothetical protein E7623_07225, partial [Ruminococcaceae bacterium]|nr:hypothetical protein [Oscillospiraceae bacterium]
MTIFFTSLNQTAFLFSFIILGYILYKLKIIPDNSQSVLSKMENLVFIPALVLGTFMENFTVAKIKETGDLLITSLFMAIIGIMVSVLLAHVCSKDGYERNIFTYALSFSNFGFMGNAVVSALFPDVFLQYLVFTLPFWSLIYLWGAPVLLIGGAEKVPLKSRLKNFL